jgi:hypothetical protein
MPLKAIISGDEHAKLPDPLRAEYVLNEKLGKHVLAVEPVEGWALEDVRGLKTVLSERTERHKEASQKLQAYGDLTPEAARAAVEQLAALGDMGDKKKLDERIAAMTGQVEQKYKSEVERRDQMVRGLTETVSRLMIDGEAARVLADPKVRGSLPLLIGPIRSAARVEQDGQGGFTLKIVDPRTGAPLLSQQQGNNGPMGLEEFILHLRSLPEYAPAFAGTGATGSGTTGTGTTSSAGGRVDPNLPAQERLRRLRAAGK